ncbi:hypothetical protein [Mesorhizobium sp.]|uniref:hypothetical protein n=1 Tax=Mesorhizobium sp. TaxID=1871066 RepID=UPI000FEA1368|nr:hypothetical protein [Mesorhizobium sp.]RWD74785.1 MAG: hypothetical protein EOS37_01545 [Mesorhizobium sp.]
MLYVDAVRGFTSAAQTSLQAVANPGLATTLDSWNWYGLDPPGPGARYIGVIKIRDALARNAPNGPNQIAMARSSILAAYAAWEHETRPALAAELGIDTNQVTSPTFGDLNKYRQAVAHVSGRLDRATEVLDLVAVGANVDLGDATLAALFDALVSEAKRLSEALCGLHLDHQFIKRMTH